MNMTITYREVLDKIDWFAMMYPEKWFVVEVKYSNGGDIAIAECRTERGKEPKEINNAYGFTSNFKNYNEARIYAKMIAKELKIKSCI